MEIAHVRCEAGEKAEIISKPYLSPLPKIDSAEMMFSASRSRRLQIVPIIQSFAQLEQNYGKEGADVIIDNTQLTIFGGFAPNSTSAEVLSKSLGSRTVMSGSVSKSKNDTSQSLQMIERPLMTPDELKSLPKGTFVVMKTGFYPMKVKLKLFFKWGIEFEEKYEVKEHGNREVHYANRSELFNNIIQAYSPVTDSDFDEANGEKKKKNENLKTSPDTEQTDSDAIRYIILSDAKKIYSFQVPKESIEELKIISKLYLTEKLEKEYKM